MMQKLALVVAIIVLSLSLRSQTLHALLFVNQQEQGREVDRSADLNNMSVFCEEIANQIGYRLNLRTNSGNEFTAREVDREINNLDVRNNDVVIFYYGGHGYNEGNDKWPTLNLTDRNYWYSDILKVLNQHKSKAKLMLCIAACCNRGYDNARLPGATFNPVSAANMKALFTDFKGKKTILMSSSKQGQLSWSDKRRGSLFGISLRSAIYELTNNAITNPTWESVHQKAREYTLSASNHKQEPQFQVIHTANPFED
ncbi:MAG: caspase family protein [Bacteroidota bacterium]